MRKDVEKYIKTCHQCQVNKPYRQVTLVSLKLMPISESPWESISFDFIDNQTKTQGYDSTLVMVCLPSGLTSFQLTWLLILWRLLNCLLRTSSEYMDSPRSSYPMETQTWRQSSASICSRH
jgi:hypothetical protein